MLCFCVKQKTAYEMRISDWSSDVCSSDLVTGQRCAARASVRRHDPCRADVDREEDRVLDQVRPRGRRTDPRPARPRRLIRTGQHLRLRALDVERLRRSEEHTSELQSLMRISYAVFCLKKKKN